MARISIYRAGDLPDDLRQQIREVAAEAFAGDDEGLVWHQARDWHVVVQIDGELAGFLGIVERTCLVNGRPARVAGFADVVTLHAWRRRGVAAAALARAAAFVRDELEAEFALLVCKHHLVPYYSRLGWQAVEGPLTFDQPSGKATYQEAIMMSPCKGRPWPGGPVDLCGLPW